MQEYAIIDTNGAIGMLENPNVEKRFLKHFSRKNLRIFIPEFVLNEIRKVRGYAREEVLSYFSNLRKVAILKPTIEVQQIASSLEEKYLESHFPDSLLLATAKIGSYTVVTYDRGLLHCAKLEGVETFCPKGGFQN